MMRHSAFDAGPAIHARSEPIFRRTSDAPGRVRRGFTLVEMLVVFMVMSMILAVSLSLVLGAMRTHEADVRFMQQFKARGELVDAFRADVAAAEAVLEQSDDLKAGPGCLILRRPDGSRVAYRLAEGTVERLEFAGKEKSQRVLPLVRPRTTIEFARAGKLLSLNWIEERGRGTDVVRRVIEHSAALGGDLR